MANENKGMTSGFRDLEKKLEKLSHLDQGKALRAATNAAGNPTLKKARATIPVGSIPHKTYKGRWVSPGFAKRSLRKKTILARNKQSAQVLIGVRSEAFYAVSFLELGTSRHSKQPWLRPAFESTKSEQINAFSAKMRDYIAKVSRK